MLKIKTGGRQLHLSADPNRNGTRSLLTGNRVSQLSRYRVVEATATGFLHWPDGGFFCAVMDSTTGAESVA
jgi:hypothetical protein